MSQQRHATRQHQPGPMRLQQLQAKLQVWLKSLNMDWLGALTRFHIVVLSIATCSIVLAFGSSLKTGQSEPGAELSRAKTQVETGARSDRKIIPLPLPVHGDPANAPSTPALALLSTNSQAQPAVQQKLADKIGRVNKSALQAARAPTATPAHATTPTTTQAQQQTPAQTRRVVKTIRKGDTLSAVFQRVGLNARQVYNITTSGDEGRALVKMFPGESLAFEFGPHNQLLRVSRDKTPLETIHFTPAENNFKVERVMRKAQIKRVHRNAIVEHSLSRAAERAGLSASTTMNMANIFGGVMDFALDVRSGDRFTVIYEEHYLDGKKLKDGTIVAAQYVNSGTAFNAFRYQHPNGEIGYYNEDGVSMRKVFLRAPLDFTRVSSSFNLRRLHPITKKVKPHRGIDYAAPRGTPVFSVGDGRVVTSGYSKANGKYVVIKHGEAYTTKYLHLHRRNVNRGQRVKQGEVIGQVGCTGLCTGPHLHYEFLANGVHRNPRTIIKKLPKAKKLAKSELVSFAATTDSTREILQHFSQQFELASLLPGE